VTMDDENRSQLQAAGLRALDRFIETFNSRDADAWAASLSYPHVRVSPLAGAGASSATAADYAAGVSYEAPDAMGWHHSAWDTKEILAVSSDKIHASAQWCRYDAQGQRILPNNVSYVITLVEGQWGIQARFGVDSPPPDDDAAVAAAATDAWTSLWSALAAGGADEVARCVRLPFPIVGAGEVSWATAAEDVVAGLRDVATGSTVGDVRPLQVGRRGVNLGVTLSGGTHGLFLILHGDDGPVVAGASVLLSNRG
jgi:hypothetical protein